jgi:hypothetical protein
MQHSGHKRHHRSTFVPIESPNLPKSNVTTLCENQPWHFAMNANSTGLVALMVKIGYIDLLSHAPEARLPQTISPFHPTVVDDGRKRAREEKSMDDEWYYLDAQEQDTQTTNKRGISGNKKCARKVGHEHTSVPETSSKSNAVSVHVNELEHQRNK